MNYENAKYIKMVVKKINEIEKKTRKPLDQPFDQYVQLVSLAFDGFKNDTACKWEYKEYTDRAKKKCFEMATKKNHMSDKWRAFYYEILQIETFEFFESFLYAMEIKRPFAKKFYEPREKTLKVVVQDLQDLEDGKYQFYGLSLPSRVGKELADDTPVLTTKGWKNHGDLVVGDKVFNSRGEAVRVTYVHPKCQSTHIVTFSDGEEIECHENHEWIVYNKHKQKTETVETREMLKNYLYNENGHTRAMYSVNPRQPIKGEYKKLPVDPYTLGAWLGDGTNVAPNITNDKKDLAIVDKIVENGYEISNTYIHEIYGTYRTSFKGLREDLQKIGMCHSRKSCVKHIPECYLTASMQQRLELLAGLLDTDGTLSKKENRYSFSTTELSLVEGVKELVETFGWRTCVISYEPRVSSSGIVGRKTTYRVDFNPTFEIPCALERKQLKKFSKQRRIGIVNIRESEKKTQGNCISVEGGEYLAGKSLKPTHNSTICLFFLAWIVMRHPLAHSAMVGHSGVLADQFYQKLLGLFTSEDYTFNELYGYWHQDGKGLVYKNSDKNIIAFENNDDFPSLVCRGIDGTWTGAVDVSSDGYLYVDDLIRDREHSLSPQRMQNTFSEYLNKCVDRKNDGAKELMVGTLWNVMDPLMRMEEMYGDDDRYLFRRIPALDFDTDESNFDYEVKGFSTQYYREMREKMIKAGNEPEWWAKFQQKPYNREGLLFPLNELGYFNGILPEGHSFESVVCADVAFGGGDNVSMPVGIKDQNTGIVYVIDWYYSYDGVQVTIPGVCDMIIKHGVRALTIERDNGGLLYAKQINEELQARGYMCACETKPAPRNTSKQDKIKSCEGKIKQMVKFLDGTKHTPEERAAVMCYEKSLMYEKALNDMSTFVTIGKNIHDDAADSIAQMCIKAFGNINSMATVEVFDRAILGF